MIAVVDTGGANIASVTNALERLGCKASLTSDARDITGASHVILPGVGAATAEQIVATLRKSDYGFRRLIHEVVQSRVFLHK